MLKTTTKKMEKTVEAMGLDMQDVKKQVTTSKGNFKAYRMAKGNSKIKGRTLTFSLPAVKSCLNCESCKSTCYALKSQRRYPTVAHQRSVNLELAKSNLELLFLLLDLQIADELGRAKKANQELFVRIHVSGDFISQDYIDMWHELALVNPEVTFFGYSKTFEIFDLDDLNNMQNVNIVNSLPNGRLNYGSAEYVAELKAELNCPVCPATLPQNKDKDIHCIEDCKLCTKWENVLFLQH